MASAKKLTGGLFQLLFTASNLLKRPHRVGTSSLWPPFAIGLPSLLSNVLISTLNQVGDSLTYWSAMWMTLILDRVVYALLNSTFNRKAACSTKWTAYLSSAWLQPPLTCGSIGCPTGYTACESVGCPMNYNISWSDCCMTMWIPLFTRLLGRTDLIWMAL